MTHSSVQSPEIERFGARPLITLLLEFHVQPGQDDDFVLPFFNLPSSHPSQIIYHKLQDTCESIIIMQSQKIRRKKKKRKNRSAHGRATKALWLASYGRSGSQKWNKQNSSATEANSVNAVIASGNTGRTGLSSSQVKQGLLGYASAHKGCISHWFLSSSFSRRQSLPFSLSWQHLLYFCADCGRKLLFCCCNVFTYIVIFKCVLWYWTSWVLHFHLLLFVFHFRDFGTFAQFIKISLSSCPSEAHKITDCLILPTNFASTPSS